ncbi:glycosyltransferase family 2 protein [Bifidobacterium pseudolongum]|uniref:glycosyltransferase family 2 protein n=1 Tax=Bifidobacterium pseudolongum TaxID=1694 RepID=UPI0022E24EBF|nr:glycosyltransferase family 2 protein [Bifidobacterium pseudolongum]
MKNDISIIIPAYKTSETILRRCLKSVDNQSNMRIEVIIVFDGAPQYETSQLQSDYRNLKILYRVVDHAGVSHARNIGLSLATSKYVMFVDADDMLPPYAIETFRTVMKDSQLAVGAFYKVQGKSRELMHPLYASSEMVVTIPDFQRNIMLPDTGNGLLWNKMYSLDRIKDNEIYFDESLSIAEDSDFVYRYLSVVDKISITDKPVYEYIRNPDSAVTSFDKDYENKVLHSMKKMEIDIASSTDIDNSYICTYYTFHILLILVHYIFNPCNGWGRKKRYNEYNRLWEMTKEYIYNSKKREFSIPKRIAIWSFRHHLFSLSRIIAWVRNRQIG